MAEGCDAIKPQLSDYLDQHLTAAEVESMDKHLAECPSCSAHLNEMRQIVHSLQQLAPMEPPEAFYKNILSKLEGGDVSVSHEAWWTKFPYKTVAAFAVIGVVVIVTNDKRKAYFAAREAASPATTGTPTAPLATDKLKALPAAPAPASAPAQKTPVAVPVATPIAKNARVAAKPTPPTTKLAKAESKMITLPLQGRAQASQGAQLGGSSSDLSKKSPSAAGSRSLYASLYDQLMATESNGKRVSPPPEPAAAPGAAPAPVVAAAPAPTPAPALDQKSVTPVKTSTVAMHKAVAQKLVQGAQPAPAAKETVVAQAPAATANEEGIGEVAANANKVYTEQSQAAGVASAVEKAEAQQAAAEEDTESEPKPRKAMVAPRSKSSGLFHDAQLHGHAPDGWNVRVVRSQSQLESLINSLPEPGDLRDVSPQFDSEILLVLTPKSNDEQTPVIENQVPDVFKDRVDIYYLQIPSSPSNPALMTLITVPKTSLPIVFKLANP